MERRKLVATLGFVAVIAGVLGTFVYLGGQGHPPDMPTTPMHKLRFNLKAELIGIETDPPADPLAVVPAGFVYDKKAVEERINKGCQACHGAPSVDLSQHPCMQTQTQPGGAHCIPDHHPPKTECIKCHRMGH